MGKKLFEIKILYESKGIIRSQKNPKQRWAKNYLKLKFVYKKAKASFAPKGTQIRDGEKMIWNKNYTCTNYHTQIFISNNFLPNSALGSFRKEWCLWFEDQEVVFVAWYFIKGFR